MPFIKINDKELEVPNGQTILEAAKTVGIEIPHYCYHRALKIVASCRMCLVEMTGAPKLVPACATPVTTLPEGKKIDQRYDAVIFTESEKVKSARASVLEFLLLNHPIDCPICDKAGECKLQDYSFEHGYDESRFIDFKRIPRKKDLGPTIFLYTSRCILCSRCVRFLEEITGTEELKIFHRGSHSEIDILPGKPLDNKMMGNVVDLCPVGCLIDKHERFEGRVWNFIQTPSICPGCSKGCNIVLDVMKKDKLNLEEWIDKVYRIRPRENAAVNQHWICDDGRYYLERYTQSKRIRVPYKKEDSRQKPVSWTSALEYVRTLIQKFSPSDILCLASPYASNEENYLMVKLAREMSFSLSLSEPLTGESVTFTPKNGQPVFTIEKEKAPNGYGARRLVQTHGMPSSIKVLFANGTQNLKPFLDRRPEHLIVLADVEDEITASADLALPVTMFYETEGTYTNKDGLTQKFNRAIIPVGEIREGWQILQDIARSLGLSWSYQSVKSIAAEMAENNPELQIKNLSELFPDA